MESKINIGTGYDVHPLVSGRWLVLGGVTIPFDKGLAGWSDADVLIHAIIDALLGAAALGDIGSHFPPGDPQYQNINSIILLEKARDKIAANGWKILNIDTTVVAEHPRLRDYIDEIRLKLSRTLEIGLSQVSVKAKTAAGLGFIGRGEGIEAHAVALLEGKRDEGK